MRDKIVKSEKALEGMRRAFVAQTEKSEFLKGDLRVLEESRLRALKQVATLGAAAASTWKREDWPEAAASLQPPTQRSRTMRL